MTENGFRHFLKVQCLKCESEISADFNDNERFYSCFNVFDNLEKLAFKSCGQNHMCDVTLVAMPNIKYGGKYKK